jgi:hypothetical protein
MFYAGNRAILMKVRLAEVRPGNFESCIAQAAMIPWV